MQINGTCAFLFHLQLGPTCETSLKNHRENIKTNYFCTSIILRVISEKLVFITYHANVTNYVGICKLFNKYRNPIRKKRHAPKISGVLKRTWQFQTKMESIGILFNDLNRAVCLPKTRFSGQTPLTGRNMFKREETTNDGQCDG